MEQEVLELLHILNNIEVGTIDHLTAILPVTTFSLHIRMSTLLFELFTPFFLNGACSSEVESLGMALVATV